MRRRVVVSGGMADLAALVVAIALGSWLVYSTPWLWQVRLGPVLSVWPMVGFLLAGGVLGSVMTARPGVGVPRPSYGRATTIALIALASVAIGTLIFRTYWSRAFIPIVVGVWLGAAFAHRFVRRRRPWAESMVVVSAEKETVDQLAVAPHARVVNVLDPGFEGELEPLASSTTLVVDLRAVLSDRMAQFVSSSVLAGLNVRHLTPVYEEHTGRLPIVHLAEGWELTVPVVRSAPFTPLKRVFDTLIILVLAPFAILGGLGVMAAVALASPGPVLFKQPRVGLNGRVFTLYKFRTMWLDAERDGPRFAVKHDNRVFPLGRWLRRFRVDEIPQMWNVLRGDLALVGPRPEQVAFVHHFEAVIPFYGNRHLVRPGITGWAQVNYGYADDRADTIEKLAYDLYYVKHMSPGLDLAILGRSLWTVITGFGAR
jgi:lipopolysaccharide/colanic/teichoic acid biosynthesis glycosyltransferase